MSRDATFRKSSRKALNGVSNLFPAGLRVLVIDDDRTCLENMEKMLKICSYEVTTCTLAVDALSMLQKKKDGFDLVISNAFMPDMDGFMLLKRILLETDLPVIMTSVDDGKDAVMRSVRKGACDYLIKPVHIEAIKNIWQHVLRKKRLESKNLGQILGKVEDHEKQKKQFDDGANWRSSKRREEDVGDDQEYSFAPKKPRVVWSAELHEQFVAAVNKLGNDNGKAVPKKILEVMNVPGLTRENVASHLQKYRLYLKRHQNRVNPPFVGAQEAALSSISSFDELDLQTLSTSGHLPPQILERTITNTSMGMSIFDQRPDSSKTGFGMLPSLQPFENVGLQLGCGFSGYDIVHGHQNNNSLMMQMGQQNEQPWFGNGLSLTSCTPTRGRSNGGHHVFDEVGQSKSRNWELQYVAHAQPINSIQSNGDFSRLSLSEAEHGDQLSSNPLITHKFVEDDFMDGFLNQQEGDEPIECEFNFDGYSMDNILPP